MIFHRIRPLFRVNELFSKQMPKTVTTYHVDHHGDLVNLGQVPCTHDDECDGAQRHQLEDHEHVCMMPGFNDEVLSGPGA